jgi:hypothetical protein
MTYECRSHPPVRCPKANLLNIRARDAQYVRTGKQQRLDYEDQDFCPKPAIFRSGEFVVRCFGKLLRIGFQKFQRASRHPWDAKAKGIASIPVAQLTFSAGQRPSPRFEIRIFSHG